MELCDSQRPEKRSSSLSYSHVLLVLQDNWEEIVSKEASLSQTQAPLSSLRLRKPIEQLVSPLPFGRRGSSHNPQPGAHVLVSSMALSE